MIFAEKHVRARPSTSDSDPKKNNLFAGDEVVLPGADVVDALGEAFEAARIAGLAEADVGCELGGEVPEEDDEMAHADGLACPLHVERLDGQLLPRRLHCRTELYLCPVVTAGDVLK